jgi:hypothetical protein
LIRRGALDDVGRTHYQIPRASLVLFLKGRRIT